MSRKLATVFLMVILGIMACLVSYERGYQTGKMCGVMATVTWLERSERSRNPVESIDALADSIRRYR